MKYEYITETAKETKSSWSNADLVRFHYFNPNGLIAEKIALDAKINELVDQGKCKSGAVIAYGSLDDFYREELRKLFNKKRVANIDVAVVVRGLAERNEYARKFIAEVSAT
jgi:hypothetical protein